MKVLITCRTAIGEKYGFYYALVNFPGSRKCYYVAMYSATNEIAEIKRTYSSKEAAFIALGVTNA